MRAQKLSISLSKQLYDFIEYYQSDNELSSRSEVVAQGLHLLQQSYLERCYAEASNQGQSEWDNGLMDGLDDNDSW